MTQVKTPVIRRLAVLSRQFRARRVDGWLPVGSQLMRSILRAARAPSRSASLDMMSWRLS